MLRRVTPARGLDGLPPEVPLLVGICSVQFGSAFADRAFDEVGPGGIAFLRVVIAALVLCAISRPSLRGRSREQVLTVLGYGLCLAGMNWSFYEALNHLPLGVAVTIEFLGPLTVAVAGSRRLLDAAWVVLAAGGVALLATRGGHGGVHLTGVLLALIPAACWGCYILLAKRVGASFGALEGLAIGCAVGSVLVLPAGLIEGGTGLLRPSVLGIGAAVAVLSSFVPYTLELIALRRLSTAVFGLLMSLEPAVAALAGVLVLGQHLTVVVSVAIVAVVLASVGSTLSARSLATRAMDSSATPRDG